MAKKRWAELSPRRRAVILVLGSVQLSLAATAWTDLATRDPEQVNGSKGKWAAIIAVNFIGPLSYFRWGRRTSA
ncbi:PLDc N-terminal domain-containing protein [Rhodococcus sp. TAF43]|jgi:Phospholipase_D-nuclease N-terminal|uniref:PLDc N-terminal domain-containing protein n=1 Tax=unclassified Rhodococcus (in: high G+C Gram-positive bacteria) TaxID=192944 RepID=UPI000E0BEDC6|nr:MULTISPECIES: PLDc N-terminal domain-containing protein [unclassified Rhodococcus (in: high G+C Gram-positive bacteria)]QKT10734.1 PLDc N-terminal domain-containing protein [Rhodococcus sp. W8901]RDI35896.1 phospholipase D-like protein [Rhodococcus sp. AG1013]